MNLTVLNPVFDRHDLTSAMRRTFVNLFTVEETNPSVWKRIKADPKLTACLKECRIEAGRASRHALFHGFTEERARKYVTRQLSQRCPERIEATITEAMQRSAECADLTKFYGLLASVTIDAMRAEKISRKVP